MKKFVLSLLIVGLLSVASQALSIEGSVEDSVVIKKGSLETVVDSQMLFQRRIVSLVKKDVKNNCFKEKIVNPVKNFFRKLIESHSRTKVFYHGLS